MQNKKLKNADANTEDVLDFVIKLANTHIHPHSVILFGSRARGDARATSDFDIAFQFNPEEYPHHWSAFCLEVQEHAPTLLPIDLINMNEISPSFATKIKAEGIIIYPED